MSLPSIAPLVAAFLLLAGPSARPVQRDRPIPTDDAYVQGIPLCLSCQFGSSPVLRVINSYRGLSQSYLKFDIRHPSRGGLRRATLRLFVLDPSVDGMEVHNVPDTSWTEDTIVWSNRPAPDPEFVAFSAPRAGWISVDVTSILPPGGGVVSIAITGAVDTALDSAEFSAKEGPHPPKLLAVWSGHA